MLAAGFAAPVFGIMNDWQGARVNSFISMMLRSCAAVGSIWIYSFDQKYRLWYIILAYISMVWSEISISYACVHIFGVRCGLYCLSYVKSSSILAASILIPVMTYYDCSDPTICGQTIAYTVSGLLILGAILAATLNPKPII